MPNWCANRVTVSGVEEDVQAFKEAVKYSYEDGEKLLSFYAIIPFPEELDGIGSPVTIVDTEEDIEKLREAAIEEY